MFHCLLVALKEDILCKKAMVLISVLLPLLFGELLVFTHIGYSEDKFLIKFATIAPEGSTWVKHMHRLDKTLREKSQGQLGLRIYAGGIAGDELDVLRKIRIGQIHCAGFSGVGISEILPMLRILDLPFLFRNDQETDLVHSELKDFFADHFRKKGFEFLAWAEVGNVYLFSNRPIQKVSDLSGLKIWTWYGDPLSKETFSLMGTNPISLTVTDVTLGLSTGMIDTFYAPPLGALAFQWQTYVKYMTALPLAHATGVVLITSDYFQKIPPNLSKMLKNEFQQAMSELTRDLREQTEEAIKLIQDSGVEIIPIPPETELQLFHETHDKIAKKLVGKFYPQELLDRVYDILKRDPHD